MSCGYVGVRYGWQEISANKKMTSEYWTAPNGNIALTAELVLTANDGECVTALAFGRTPEEAGHQARNALLKDFDRVQQAFVDGWKGAQSQSMDLGKMYETGFDLYRVSNTILRTHEEKSFPCAVIASLSIPWRFSKGDDALVGYDFIWPRHLAQAASAFVASADTEPSSAS